MLSNDQNYRPWGNITELRIIVSDFEVNNQLRTYKPERLLHFCQYPHAKCKLRQLVVMIRSDASQAAVAEAATKATAATDAFRELGNMGITISFTQVGKGPSNDRVVLPYSEDFMTPTTIA